MGSINTNKHTKERIIKSERLVEKAVTLLQTARMTLLQGMTIAEDEAKAGNENYRVTNWCDDHATHLKYPIKSLEDFANQHREFLKLMEEQS